MKGLLRYINRKIIELGIYKTATRQNRFCETAILKKKCLENTVLRRVFKMDISLFDFELPEELIAQSPAKVRDESRLLVIDKDKKSYEDKIFHDIVDYFKPGDVLVRYNTKVIPTSLFG